MRLARLVVRLGMIQVNLGDGGVANVGGKEGLGVLHGVTNMVQPTLIGAAGRIANHHGQDVDGEMVQLWAGQSAAQGESAIAAAQIQDDRSRPAEDRFPVQRTWVGQPLQGGSRPLRFREDRTGNGHAELVLDLARLHDVFPLRTL